MDVYYVKFFLAKSTNSAKSAR